MVFEAYRNHNLRLRIFYLIFGLLFMYLGAGLVYRQIIKGNDYRQKEKQQNHRRILVPGPRGTIVDRENRLLVGNRPHFSAVVYLDELRPEFRRRYIELVREARATEKPEDRDDLQVEARRTVVQNYLDRINRILNRNDTVQRRQVERHFRQNLLLPLPLIRDLEPEEYALLVEQIPIDSPIQIHTKSARFYPHRSTAAHALGFVKATDKVPKIGVPGSEWRTLTFKGTIGVTGVERSFNQQLIGISGGEIWVVDPSGFQYQSIERKLPVAGGNIIVSIDIDLQQAAENALGEKTGAVAAINVKNGEVYVLASKPDFDLNLLSPFIPQKVFSEITARGAWLNRATAGLYPPGSAFKIITAIAGFDAGAIAPDTIIDCTGSIRVGNRRFSCHNPAGHGPMGLEMAIVKSCNVFFYEIGLRTGVGVDRISAVARRFGLDLPTGIELPNETRRMIVPSREWKEQRGLGHWYRGDDANLAIGQGYLRVTPLQMACMTASLARKELRTRPTLVHQEGANAIRIRRDRQPLDLSEASYRRIINGMYQAAQIGTARLVRIPGFSIAAKTGTAQVRAGKENLTLAWFIGFAPVEDPEIAVAVVVEGTEPDDDYAGGKTAAPIARELLERFRTKADMSRGGPLAIDAIPR